MLFIGHRGAVGIGFPENTLVAVDRALRQGADGVEIDVRLTSDGVPVCHHDAAMRRTAGDPRQVASVRSHALPLVQGYLIPTLSDMIDLVGDRGRLIIEMKTPGWAVGTAFGTVNAVAGVLRRHRLHDVVVSSFDRPCASAMRTLDLPVRTALLGRPGVPLDIVVRRAMSDGHEEVHPHVSSLLARLHLLERTGLPAISAWTVARPGDLQRNEKAGVGAAICDDPRAARRSLGSTLVGAGQV